MAFDADDRRDPLARVLKKLATRDWVRLYESLRLEFALAAEGLARAPPRAPPLGVLAAPPPAPVESGGAVAGGGGGGGSNGGGVGWLNMSGDDALRGVLRAWDAYRDWCEEVDERCELLNERISQERHQGVASACSAGVNSTPFIRDAALLAFRNNFLMNVQVCAAVSAVAQHAAADAADAAEAGHARADGRDGRRMGGRKRARSASDGGSGNMGVGSGGAGDAGTNNEDSMLFTDLELVEDCRALNFSVQHDRRSTGSERGLKTSTSTAERHHRHYYDWILERVEGRAEDILRGTVDARGIAGGVKSALSTAAPESRQQLLSRLLSAVEELDVPDDDLSGDRQTQGSMRRALLLPLLRWRAAMDECAANRNDNDEPSALLMQDIGGKHRGKGRGGGRAAAHARAAVRGCVGNAGASWKQLSNVFS